MLIEELYQEYYDMLWKFARTLAKHEAEADELVQETFLRAVKNSSLLATLPSYKKKAWLYRVLRNYFYDLKRKQKFEINCDEFHYHSTNVDFDTDLNVESIMRHVPEDSKDIIFKKFILGMKSEEIGRELGIAAGTVRYRIHKVMKVLRARLKDCV